jgi:hypothetical protein
MAKDPAVLFYTGDFLSGAYLLDYEQRGKYITLLCLQHQKGRLTEKDMFNICGTYDEDIFSKFVKDENGLYYNERMEAEALKRLRYSESRSNNRKKKEKPDSPQDVSNTSKTYVPHMGNENENRNRIKNSNIKKEFIPPTYEDVLAYAKSRGREDLARKFYDYFTAAEWVDSNGKPVIRWKAKFITWENNSEKPPEKASSFDTEDFFQAALKRTYGDLGEGPL